MFKKLRVKLILIMMVLVGAVLAGVLGGSLLSARKAQERVVSDSLTRSLTDSVYRVPRIVDPNGQMDDGAHESLLILCVDLDADGEVLSSNRDMVAINTDVLNDLISTVLESDQSEGTIPDYHVTWKKTLKSNGAWRVVMADTSDMDRAFELLAIQDAVIIGVALVAVLLISWGLSGWMVRPIKRAWDQQRRFVADASHELKTPLAVIIANTQILAKDEAIPEESRRWVKSTDDEARHMKALVEELLELARTDESQADPNSNMLHREDVNFSELVDDAALEFDAIAFERGSEIQTQIEEGIRVEGDREWLARLAKIFIDNACKYTAVGEPIRVTLTREGKKCRLSVNNKGNVIAPEDLEHVFDRFYRTDKARSRQNKTGGFGLGLAIAKGIANAHRGDASATSSEEAGTTFTVTLPCE